MQEGKSGKWEATCYNTAEVDILDAGAIHRAQAASLLYQAVGQAIHQAQDPVPLAVPTRHASTTIHRHLHGAPFLRLSAYVA